MSTLANSSVPTLAGPARPHGWRLHFVALRREEMAGQTPLAELLARVRRTQGDEAATELLDVLADALVRAEGLGHVAAPVLLSDAETRNVTQWQRESEADLRDGDAGVPTPASKKIIELCRLVRRLNGEDLQ